MHDAPSEIEVYETRRFEKALAKLSEPELKLVEDQIDQIIADPEIGEQKKGDLSHLRVHKFRLNGLLTLLGYSWLNEELTLYLLNIGPHENFYREMKKHRKGDQKLLKP